MALRVNYNYQSEFGHYNLVRTERSLNTSLERLETGYRINSAKDDAAGLFIADQLRLVARGLEQGSANAQNGISAAQIAETNLSQIYDKLTTMYTKLEQSANDVNDVNARNALKSDLYKLVDAVDKIAKGSEFNGINLLDGTFTNKVIHYGARADQSLEISIDGARAQDLGAYVVDGSGASKASGDTTNYATLLDGTNFAFDTGDTITVAGVDLKSNFSDGNAIDAKTIADAINDNDVLTGLGIEADATNKVTASANFSTITTSSDSVEIKFFIGKDQSSESFSITIGTGESLTLDTLIDQINSEAASHNTNLTASEDNGKLHLETNGETIGIEVTNNDSSITVNLNTLLNVSSTTVSGGDVGAAIKVGDLDIIGDDAFTYDFTGVSNASEGLGINGTSATKYTLNNVKTMVDTNAEAELAMKIIDKTIKAVDTMRGSLGSIQQNLEALIDNNDFAAVQTQEAESRIRNVDFAKEMANFTKQQTLMQSGMAMLAQANQLPQMVLQLLR